MRAILACGIIGFLLLISTFAQASTGSSTIEIVDSTTASSVDQSTDQPINRTVTFSVNDTAVNSWLQLANVPSPSHSISWVWISPTRAKYSNQTYSIPDPGQGKTWGTYYIWSYIYIAGQSAAQMQGTWEVDVYIDGTMYLTQYFTIATTAVPIQPTEDFAWSSSTIPVYVQSSPGYARADVEKAMLQWNFSQAWFKRTYALQQRPVLSLSMSNDSASPIKVTFNQTQSSSNWGWTSDHYYYDASGRFTSVSCAVSIVLTLSDGTPLNDIALQDVAEHELGHCLGLWHTAQSADLMNHLSGSFVMQRYPSTLNLYALYELSSATQVSQVPSYYILPNSIGYAFAPAYSNSSTITTATSTTNYTTSNGISTSVTNTTMSTSTSSTPSLYTSTTKSINSSTTFENTSQGNGIPEFPYQLLIATAFVIVLGASYALIRRHELGAL